MCGIIGYIGKRNAIKVLYTGLKNLEYRGYDSAGISYFINKSLRTRKAAGTVNNLFENLDEKETPYIGIGHTRWATHGKASDINSHPQLSHNGLVSVVHNGIIENYLELKSSFKKNCFISETDTEVISNLIEKFYLQSKNKLDSILKTITLLKGSYALCIIFNDDNKNIYFARKFSPLIIGIGKNEFLISSDILGFAKFTNKFVEIPDDSYGLISFNNYKIFSKNGKEILMDIKTFNQKLNIISKNGYPHYMLKEINEIPRMITKISKTYCNSSSPLLSIKESYFKNINRVRLIACGTSYHASLIGASLFINNMIDASADIASEFIYSNPAITKSTLCIFLSQSGETADTISAIKIAKEKGSKTICLTNVLNSTIAKACDYALPLLCGPEIAVASTKAYNSELVILLILTNFIKNQQKNDQNLKKQLLSVSKNISIEKFTQCIKPLVKPVLEAKNIFILGRQQDYVSALETSLKLKEISYINCQGYASGELKHGTISLIDKNSLVFAFITSQNLASKTISAIEQVKARGAKVCIISQLDFSKNPNCDYIIKLDSQIEKLMPVISIIPLQLLAYYVSTSLGNDPDKPRNLAKSVTVE